MSPIRSFVVRIYRRDRTGVAGTVEDVRGGSPRAFHSLAELWAALSAPRKRVAAASPHLGPEGTPMEATGPEGPPTDSSSQPTPEEPK